MPKLEINGVGMYYEQVGGGPAIAFIHGGYGGAASTVMPREELWVGSFTDAYTVVTYDRRNAGRSDYVDDECTLETLASDLRDLLTRLDIERSVVVGSSAGGPVALTYALAYPETVIALVLPNTSARLWAHEGRAEAADVVRSRFAHLKAHGAEATFELMEQQERDSRGLNISPRGRGPTPPGLEQELAERERKTQELVTSLPREDRIHYAIGELLNQAAYMDSDLRPRLRDINVPTLVVHGDADTQVPYELGVELSKSIPGAEMATVPGAGHGVMQWQPAIEAIRAFCDRVIVRA